MRDRPLPYLVCVLFCEDTLTATACHGRSRAEQWRYSADHAGRPIAAIAGGRRPDRAHPRHRRQGARPIVDAHEKAETYPDGVFAQLGAAGLLSLPQPEEWGGGGQPYEVYLQVLEEIAARWAAVAVAVSVHSLSSHPLLTFGTEKQKQRWLPGMLSGEQIGAYSLSEPQAGSDAAALRCAAAPAEDGGYVINGSKSWITHGGRADFYTLFARTGEGSRGISCFLVPGDLPGLSFGKPEEKMGLAAVPTTSAFYDRRPRRRRPAHRRRRAGPADRVLRTGLRPAGHRRGRRRHRAGRARRGDRLRQRANDVRPQDHRPPGPGLPARRHGRRGGQRPGHLSGRRAPARRRPAVLAHRPASPSWSPPTPR